MDMSIMDVIRSRRSVRSYKPDPIPKDTLDKILESARFSPSAGNRQPYKLIVVTDKQVKEEMAKGKYNRFIAEAPVVVVGCDHVGNDFSRRWSLVDTAIALEHIVLAAWNYGVGSCWIGDFSKPQLRELLDIPQDYEILGQITLGFPARLPEEHKKKSLEEIVSWERFK